MREIADFIGGDLPESRIYDGLSSFYRRIAIDLEGGKAIAGTLEDFLSGG